jgi:hypothetical protein
MNPRSRVSDPARVLAASLIWEPDPEDVLWFRSYFDGAEVYLRMNNFPDENLYSLWLGDGQFLELEDLQPNWTRKGPLAWPPTARSRGRDYPT